MLSIITPVLNGEEFIESNIQAISKLTIPFEHLIVDGGSSDRTINIVSLYPHVRLINQIDKEGMYSAINKGLASAVGEYVTYINCDDLIDPVNFSLMYENILNSRSDFIYSDGYFKYSDTGKLKFFKSSKLLFRFFLKNGIMPFNQPCSIYTKKLYVNLGGFDSENFKWCGDLDFFRKVAFINQVKIKYINIPTVTFLIHANSLTSLHYKRFYDEFRSNSIPIPNLFVRGVYLLSRIFKL